jgi:phage terminase large subunit-like protein
VWKLNGGAPDLSVFEDSPVYVGLDLFTRQDLTAPVLVAQDSAGVVHLQPHFRAPAQGLRERADRDRAQYDLWRSQGFLTATPGASVDHEMWRPTWPICRPVAICARSALTGG